MAGKQPISKRDYTFGSVVGRDIPLAFGANFNDDPICRSTLGRSHTLGMRDLQHPVPEEDVANFVPYQQYDFAGGASTMITSAQAWGAGTSGSHLNASQRSNTNGSSQPPKAVDETVLRFLGYFVEPVLESNVEATRVRKLALLFHCADESILLREAVQVNSGINQGVMLKRQRVPIEDDPTQWITVSDLNIGAKVTVFGKEIYLVDATEATRIYLRDVVGRTDIPSAPLPWPSELDTYNGTVTQKLVTHPRRLLPTADYDHKRANEAMRGSGVISKHAPADVRTAQQFFRNRINEHLQFAAYWDDRERKSGDLRLVVIRYFLENDTVEIVEQRDDNSGREGAAKLLCRQRVSHPEVPQPQMHEAQQNTYGLLLKENYLSFDDFTIGTSLKIEGRTYITYDADVFTRNWYKAQRSVVLPPAIDISAVIAKSKRVLPVQYPAPHNGWGSEEDSIRSCKSLLLKPPPLDVAKMARENGKVMVFDAILFNPTQPEDVGREFVICFHRATDAVEITERQLRNSGIVGGKFLAKGRHLKSLPDGRRVPYSPNDFVVSQIVRIAGRDFLLKEMDERSRKLVEGEFDKVTEDRIKALIVAFRELLNSKYFRAHEAFRAVAPDGSLTAKQLMEFFSNSAGDITQDEANHLIHYFSAGQGAIPYDRFLRIMDPGNTTNLDEAANSVRSIKGVEVFDRDTAEGRAKAVRLATITATAEDAASVQRLKRQFAEKLVQRRGTVQESFRMLSGHVLNARLTYDALKTALSTVLRIKMDAREEQLLLAAIFDTDAKRANGIDVKTFHEFVEAV